MRIAMLTSVHAWNDVRIYEKEAQSLAERGHEVVVVGPADSGRTSAGRRLNAESRMQSAECRMQNGAGRRAKVAHVLVKIPKRRVARMVVGGLRMLSAGLKLRASVYHFHDPELLPVGLFLRLMGRRVAYDVHEDYAEQILSKHYLPAWMRRGVARVFGWAEKLAARRLDGVVAATDHIAGKFTGARVVVVRNYPTCTRRSAVCNLHSGSGGPFRICHLASVLSEERGVSSLVRAMEHLGDGFELVLAGRFVPEEYEQEVRRMAGFRWVRYVGVVPHAEVWRWYEQCDAGAVCLLPVPRFKVSLPVKLFEFMSAGLAVVASDFPLFREIVEGSKCGVCVDPARPEEIARAVRRLAGNPEECRRMGANGIAAVQSRYNWESEAATLARFYEELVR
ncbi:MAG: glycosyltransferase family 4 protein [candidate division WOR-3 bacterium]